MFIRPLIAAALLTLSVTVHAEAPKSFEVGALTFQRPDAWQWVPVNSPMRKAHLQINGAEAGQTADITFFHFGQGMGGGIQANAQRWLGQFQSAPDVAKTESKAINGVQVTLVTTEGTFSSGMPGGPTQPLPNYALMGAMIENPAGDVFIKMTGPAALVKAQHQAFLDFITAAIPKK